MFVEQIKNTDSKRMNDVERSNDEILKLARKKSKARKSLDDRFEHNEEEPSYIFNDQKNILM
ncbi:hypothetical protein HHI36_005521, partial [Cryptolaemus montrouzieri]